MDLRPSIIERAYQLAASGACATVSDIAERLTKEGYMNVRGHLTGRAIYTALRKACAAARSAPPIAQESGRD